ncbi:elongation factor G [Streptomyces ureilyticus]|uniref:TetM/TetW/TetO/TetS family tetracycline resistance ribosomal protection protein n=1 Tax=Streptomyces ureilyticus TaxID=1775131 RepID=A0ABX0E8P2_9ACTN|nr:TetM/TetW/TetO/TetS family tetracycline resistance ribosomal protection protein [Streptomyces ureilyticus]NGO47852.1 TetM/TetW/TetO/TetS family tetracycline resistance ribosomal protection protein [Streptomyces ureilyticus]
MHTLNLGILAHVDAGKTSLTERLLHTVGVIDEIGSVDDGSTQTDSLALERQRGITIKSAVVAFAIDDVTVNLIDTPGHPDFIAEVERVLSVLDGAVLVISAVEGVQAQTRVLMRTLQRLRIPTLIFVNKIDRAGARYTDLLQSISTRLTPAIFPMGEVRELGTREAHFTPYDGLPPRLLELLAEHDDALLAAYVDDEATVSQHRLRTELAAQTGQSLVHPVFFGSAVTGAGVDELIGGIRELLPSTEGDADGPVSGTVFKVERGPAGEKIAYVRMFSGTLRTRDRVTFGDGEEGKVTGITVFDQGSDLRDDQVTAGRIGRLWGLTGIRIGDTLGVPRKGTDEHYFSPPTLETVVVPRDKTDKGALHLALTQLAEQDPLINLRHDEIRQETSVSLYGEVQKEVIQATLADEFGLDVGFRETTPLCIERLVGTGAAVEFNGKDPNPFLATVGLRVDPAPVGAGMEFRLEVELGSMPYAFFKAVEDTVRETLGQGPHGWQVTDCTVTMTHSGYSPRQSHAHQGFDKSMSSTGADFRGVTPLVLMNALRQAGTLVHEPMHAFRVETPADTLGAVLPVLAKLRAVPQTTQARGTASVLEGRIPAAQVHQLEQRLPALTRGEGELETAFDHYAPVAGGALPERERTDHNPLDRKEYLLNVTRRVGA